MTEAMLAGLLLFITTVAQVRAWAVTEARIFVGVQAGEGDLAYAWTKCDQEHHVFVVQVAEKTLTMGPEKIRFAAAHEVCHVLLHGRTLCGEVGPFQAMESSADRCAVVTLASMEAGS